MKIMCHETLSSCFIWFQWFLYFTWFIQLHTVHYIYGVSRCDFFTFFRVSEFIAWICFLSGNLKPCQTKLLSSISVGLFKMVKAICPRDERRAYLYSNVFTNTFVWNSHHSNQLKDAFFSLHKIRHVNSHLETQVG